LHGPLTLTNAALGAVYARGRSKVFARGVAFTKCGSKMSGGVISAMDTRVELLECNFTENWAPATGAIESYFSCTPYSSADDDDGSHVLSITDSRFERNAAAVSWGVRSYSYRTRAFLLMCCLLPDMGCAL
jgi:hypothetical protein